MYSHNNIGKCTSDLYCIDLLLHVMYKHTITCHPRFVELLDWKKLLEYFKLRTAS